MIVLCALSFFLYQWRTGGRSKDYKEVMYRGVIVDATTNSPIQGVYIGISGTNPRSMSNDDGEYMITARNSDNLIFKHNNYESIIVPIAESKIVKMKPKEKDNSELKEQIRRDFAETDTVN